MAVGWRCSGSILTLLSWGMPLCPENSRSSSSEVSIPALPRLKLDERFCGVPNVLDMKPFCIVSSEGSMPSFPPGLPNWFPNEEGLGIPYADCVIMNWFGLFDWSSGSFFIKGALGAAISAKVDPGAGAGP